LTYFVLFTQMFVIRSFLAKYFFGSRPRYSIRPKEFAVTGVV
jgi:hypothetical protein